MLDFGPFLAGAFSGGVSAVFLQPLDVIKTRLQMENNKNVKGNMRTVFVGVVNSDGVAALWKGLSPSLLRTIPGLGLYFTTVNWLTYYLCTYPKPTSSESFITGVSSRLFAGTITMPFTVLKTRYESGKFDYTNISNALVSMTKKEGFRSNFQGYTATIIRDIPYSGLYFMLYNHIKSFLIHGLGFDDKSMVTFLSCSSTSGLLASTISHPTDLLKTRVQAHTGRVSYASVIKDIYKNNGLVGFLSGLTPRLLKKTFGSIIAWTTYEKVLVLYKSLD